MCGLLELASDNIEPVRKALEGEMPEDLKPRIRALVHESYSRLSTAAAADTAKRRAAAS